MGVTAGAIQSTEPAPRQIRCGTADDIAAAHAGMADQLLTDRFRDLELTERRLVAERALLVAEVERRSVHRADGHSTVAAWLRAHADWSPAQVRQARRLARLLDAVPLVADALLEGRIGVAQAEELAHLFANPRCGHLLEGSIGVLLDLAQRLAFAEFRVCARRWMILADLDGAHRDRGDDIAARTASVHANSNGVVVSVTGGTALQAAEILAVFEEFVRVELERDLEIARATHDGDGPLTLPRTDRQRRFDAFCNMCRCANHSDVAPIPAPATVDVVVDQHTFETHSAEHGLAEPPDDLPPPDPATAHCETAAGVPLLPDEVVAAALHGHVRRVVIDSAGVVTDLGRRQRLFTGATREAAKLLVRRCQYPGCAVPSSAADVDHLAEWRRHHGPTSTRNATVLCGRHNRWKHFCLQARRDRRGQVHFQRPDGTWLTPVGRPPPREADLLPLDGQH